MNIHSEIQRLSDKLSFDLQGIKWGMSLEKFESVIERECEQIVKGVFPDMMIVVQRVSTGTWPVAVIIAFSHQGQFYSLMKVCSPSEVITYWNQMSGRKNNQSSPGTQPDPNDAWNRAMGIL